MERAGQGADRIFETCIREGKDLPEFSNKSMKSVDSLPGTTFSGHRFTRKQLAFVQRSVERFPNLSRKELAQTLCEHLRWKTANGKNKTEACLKMLQALEDHGIVKLPDMRERATPKRPAPSFDHDPCDAPIECALESVLFGLLNSRRMAPFSFFHQTPDTTRQPAHRSRS